MGGVAGRGAEDLVVFERASDFVLGVSEDGTIEYANERLLSHLGLTLAGVTGTNVLDHLHPDEVADAIASFGTLAGAGRAVTSVIFRVRTADGSYRPIEWSGTSLLESGPLSGWFVLSGRYPGDLILERQVRSLLMKRAPLREVMALIPEFGAWRHPEQHYGVSYRDEEGGRAFAGSETVGRLVALHDEPATPWARAASTGIAVVCDPDELPPDLASQAAWHGLGSCGALPVADPRFDELVVVVNWTTGGPAFEWQHYSTTQMVRVVEFVLEWQSHVAQLERLAQYDHLTGVANRSTFYKSLSAAGSSASAMTALLYVDLDCFKDINDLHGHRVGDLVLVEAAARMASVLRVDDLLARVGGDEFVVFCRGLQNQDEAITVTERVLKALAEPIRTGALELTVAASIGLAIQRRGDAAKSFDALVERADQALLAAKSAGKGRWHMATDVTA
ncbi:MAG TPA: sensor domain-containing diguanylate cyclase [Acidimicrobiales bacterium]|nr:sensor domain-containing diguanylate cyclase [Acidimicrobiales bacterium]